MQVLMHASARAPSEHACARLMRHDARDALGSSEPIELPNEGHELRLAFGDESTQPLSLEGRVAPLEICLHLRRIHFGQRGMRAN